MQNKIHTINCIDCNEVLAFTLNANQQCKNPRCFTCMCTFTELAGLLHATNLPDIQDTYNALHNGSQDAQTIRIKCMKTIKELQK